MEQVIPYMKYLVLFVVAVIVILWGISIYFVKIEKMSVQEWSKRSLGLPQGTVRALIAFIILFVMVIAIMNGEDFPELPDWLVGILGAVIGFYFGAATVPKAPEQPPKNDELRPHTT